MAGVGAPGLADAVDIGETSYSMVLADDLDNNGKLDLVVSTMNGNIYAFQTQVPYHPLKTWTSQVSRQAICLMLFEAVNAISGQP